MSSWAGGFDGTLFTREECSRFLAAIPKEKLSWVKAAPALVIHNTGAPNMKQEDATPDTNHDGTGEDDRIRNTAPHYKAQGWSGGPNFFVFNSGHIGVGTPLPSSAGVHSPSWNHKSIGVEMVADFRPGVDDPYKGGGLVITDTAAWLFAQMLLKLGYPCNGDTVKLHKEDKATSHDCPGSLFKKDEFLRRIQAYMGGEVPVPAPAPTQPVAMWTNTPGDTLNFRAEPAGRVKGSLPTGTRVEVHRTDGSWSFVKTPGGYLGWVSSKYLLPAKPAVAASMPASSVILPSPAPAPVSGDMPPGSYHYSQFCEDWCHRFEGLMLTAYWDKNDYAIGYGHNNASGVPPAVTKGMTCTKEEAVKWCEADLNLQLHYLEAYVDVPLSQGWVDALVLHIFQQGPGNFRNGKVRPLVNAMKWQEAAATIRNWPTSNEGLRRRRGVEAEIALGGKPTKW